MNIQCQNCGAFYSGSISSYKKFVKCPYCDSVIDVNPGEQSSKKKRLLVREVIEESSKMFKINEFADFLVRRGAKTFDPVSGILKVGSQQVYISEEGAVEGPERLKSRVEKWIAEFMSET